MSLEEVLALTPARFEEWLKLAGQAEKNRVLRTMHKKARGY